MLGDPVEDALLDDVLGADSQLLDGHGLVRRSGSEVAATVRVVPHDDLLIACDTADARTGPEHVAGVHGPSAILAHLTVRSPVERALDLCTGNGVQALLLARHAAHVVATDVNPRALAFAAFNAALNGVENIELREGSYVEPVQGERFQLVVANPPYVISPESALLFRDSGLRGDAVSEQLVSALPSHLEEGAFATIMVSWVVAGDDDEARARSWVEGSSCNALILAIGVDDPFTTAAMWNRDLAGDAESYGMAIDRWLGYFEREGIDAIGYGAVVLRRRQRPGWVTSRTLPGRVRAPAGEHVERMFDAEDALAELDDDALLDSRVVLLDSVRLEQLLAPRGGSWSVTRAELLLPGGLGFRGSLDELALRLALHFGGQETLRGVADAVARETGDDRDTIAGAAVRLARELVGLGFATFEDTVA